MLTEFLYTDVTLSTFGIATYMKALGSRKRSMSRLKVHQTARQRRVRLLFILAHDKAEVRRLVGAYSAHIFGPREKREYTWAMKTTLRLKYMNDIVNQCSRAPNTSTSRANEMLAQQLAMRCDGKVGSSCEGR